MPIPRGEVESPALDDWIFEDELGIEISCGAFIVPSSDTRSIVSRMAKFTINDGRSGVARTERFRSEDPRTIQMMGVPYNIAMEFMNRIGVRFRIQDHTGGFLWAVLDQLEMQVIPGGQIWFKTEQFYNLTLTFSRVSPI